MRGMGHSGAVIQRLENAVWKTGGSRVAEQARYLARLPAASTPRVQAVFDDGYVMERLCEVDLYSGVDALLLEAREVLARTYWPLAGERIVGWREALETWIAESGYDWLTGLAATACQDDFPPCLVHGDPTAANLMRRADGQLVLIDPLPPGGKVPSEPAVDVGKLLQSALGWEHVLDPQVPLPWPGTAALLLRSHRREFQQRAWFWCAVHCARVLPYAKEPAVRRWAVRNSRRAADAVRL